MGGERKNAESQIATLLLFIVECLPRSPICCRSVIIYSLYIIAVKFIHQFSPPVQAVDLQGPLDIYRGFP